MRLGHFEALTPLCPRCLGREGRQSPITIARDLRWDGDDLIEGLLLCSAPDCQLEFPVIDGIPLLVADVRATVTAMGEALLRRRDLSPLLESALGDCLGPGSSFDTERQHLSIYAWDHYGALDPDEAPLAAGPSGALRCLQEGLALCGEGRPEGPQLDLGCAVGGNSFALAASSTGLVLGGDLSFPMLRMARQVLKDGALDYRRRRVGLVYDQRRFPVPQAGAERVDFWLFDALQPPFAAGCFGFVSAINLIDCLANPPAFPAVLAAQLRPGGCAVLTTPFDWSTAATAVEGWIGGHSQRGPAAGASEPPLDALLDAGGLTCRGTRDPIPWTVRLHDRAAMTYQVRVLALERA